MIAALALEKQYGLDEQQARMIFDLRFRFMFGTARTRTRQHGNWTYA